MKTKSQNINLKYIVVSGLFAACITMTTAYLFHIPFPGGYIHLGDVLIYMVACLLPTPYAAAAAAIGAGLADLLTYPAWCLPTLVIKSCLVFFFTSRASTFLCKRNYVGLVLASAFSPAAYGLCAVVLYGSIQSFWPQFAGTAIQSLGNGVIFLIVARAVDMTHLKQQMEKHVLT
ncbi:TIGR04002 family protein [Pseudoflavonifractor gallinarum]|uniref:TIGR04002 family protein n=1 Tax=Pseudoflavonifractor gallinarum TaxID=2779352 RepID=UPI0036F40D5F